MIPRRLEDAVFAVLTPASIRYLTPVSPGAAQGLVADVYRQARADFQLVAPLLLHSPIPTLLAGVWAVVRESLVAGPASRAEREQVAIGVSRANACPYCVEAHTMMLGGVSSSAGDPATAPSQPGDCAQVVGTAVAFHYLNRVANVFLTDSPVPWAVGKSLQRKAGTLLNTRLARLDPAPGEALSLLPEAPLPEDFAWARRNPNVAGAWARFAHVVEQLAAGVPPAVRGVVEERIRAWDGADPGLGMEWLERAVRSVPADQQPPARLALLVACCSYRVTARTIADVQSHNPDPARLLSLVAWASFTAARQVGARLGHPAQGPLRPAQGPEPRP